MATILQRAFWSFCVSLVAIGLASDASRADTEVLALRVALAVGAVVVAGGCALALNSPASRSAIRRRRRPSGSAGRPRTGRW